MIRPGAKVRSILSSIRRFFAHSGTRKSTTVVVCPPARFPAKVELDAANQVESCSRWNDLQEACSVACSPQIQFSAQELQDFKAQQEGKKCSSCDGALTAEDWYRNRLTVFQPSTEGCEVAKVQHQLSPEDRFPLCSNCYGARIFIRKVLG